MAIRTARAVTEEVREVAQSSVGNLARVRENNSERDVHKLADKFKLTLPIPLSLFKAGDKTIHYVKMSNWASFLLSFNLWHHLCGLGSPDMGKCGHIWTTFWEQFQQTNPGHEVFSRDGRDGFDLSRCCGLLLHGDEGRTLRKQAILILSCHSILGYGIRTSCSTRKKDIHKLNYLKSTWATRFLLGILPKTMHSVDEESTESDDDVWGSDVYESLLNAVAQDLKHLWEQGMVSPLDGQKYFFCIINVIGDWPWLQKAGHLGRSFMNAAKHSSTSRSTPKGICHQCCADQPGCIFSEHSFTVHKCAFSFGSDAYQE